MALKDTNSNHTKIIIIDRFNVDFVESFYIFIAATAKIVAEHSLCTRADAEYRNLICFIERNAFIYQSKKISGKKRRGTN